MKRLYINLWSYNRSPTSTGRSAWRNQIFMAPSRWTQGAEFSFHPNSPMPMLYGWESEMGSKFLNDYKRWDLGWKFLFCQQMVYAFFKFKYNCWPCRLLETKDFQLRYGVDEAYWSEDVRLPSLWPDRSYCKDYLLKNANVTEILHTFFFQQLAKVLKEKKASLLLTLVRNTFNCRPSD